MWDSLTHTGTMTMLPLVSKSLNRLASQALKKTKSISSCDNYSRVASFASMVPKQYEQQKQHQETGQITVIDQSTTGMTFVWKQPVTQRSSVITTDTFKILKTLTKKKQQQEQQETVEKILVSIYKNLDALRLGNVVQQEQPGDVLRDFATMNRNARKPRRANHGKRPCSRVARRNKRRAFGNHRR